ncbi:Teichuronic acid biosynthesis protein TuaB [termite gut metagenome]|uniref:Teichuronic acid biosynthesis protein TuaB n=1 Tax=termite gut metagenome TaxID=433724 RepID=A0A5J4RE50_9ZZZZ
MTETLKEKTAKGLFWGGLSNGVQQLLNLVFGIFLARILNADDYGVVGMLTIISLIATSLQEGGFIAALVNKKEVSHKDYNAVFWFSTLTGLSLYIILFFCAPLIAKFYHTPELVSLAHLSFLCLPISALGIASRAFLFRNLKVKEIAVTSVSALIISGITGVIFACNGMSYWGIAIQNIIFISIITLLNCYFSHWHPTLSINFNPLREMISFSYKLLVSGIFMTINNNLFSVLLGKFYSEEEVGYFTQANKWNYMGHSLITGMLQGVTQPVLTRVEDIDRQRHIFRKMLRFTAFVSFPAMFGISLIAHELIIISITDKWLPAAVILQLLCIGGAFIPIVRLYSDLIISKGKSDIYMWVTICNCLVQLPAMLLLYPYGVQNMITVYVIINICWLFVWHYYLQREIKLPLLTALKDILPFAGIAAFVLIATYFITANIENLYLLIIGKIIIAGTLYIAILWIFRATALKESITFLFKRKQKQ